MVKMALTTFVVTVLMSVGLAVGVLSSHSASAATLTCVASGFSVQIDGSHVLDPGKLATGVAQFNQHNANGDSCTLT